MVGQRVGYIRVSTAEQSTHRQLEGITLDKTFTDYASGKNSQRPQLQALLEYVRENDRVLVHSLDRLARNLDDLRKIVQQLTARGIVIEFIKENLTFSGQDSPMAQFMLSVMGAFAEFERAIIRERQQEGIELAKKRGAFRGRPKSLNLETVTLLRERVKAGEQKTKIARDLKITRTTLYQYLAAEEKP